MKTMIEILEQWIALQLELDKELDLVRTRLPAHIVNPDPDIYRSKNYVALDFETTTIGKGLSLYPDNSIVLAAWELGPDHPRNSGGAAHHMRYKFAGEYSLTELVRDIDGADFIIAHNAKFELGWLSRCGLDLSNVVVWDTMIGEYVIGGNRWVWHMLSLEASARRRLGDGKHAFISKLYKLGVCSTEIPASWLRDYCIQDVALCRRLFQKQLDYMVTDGMLLPVMFTRCLATPVLADMETNGMRLDETQVTQLTEDREREYAEVTNELERVTGGINVNSPKQLATYLYEDMGFSEVRDHRGNTLRTATDRPRTDAATIAKLNATTKEQRRFVELFTRSKELYNELTKYLRKFRDCCADVGGVLRAVFNQTNTRTHRLSSTGLDYSTQFQNFPRAYKPMFRARTDGWLIGEADGAQLEFRVAAHLGRDQVALGDIIGGTDIHSVTAGVIGVSRQDAKPHTFKPLYGGRSGTPNEVRYYEFFREKYRGVTETQQRWIDEVLLTKSLRTEWGLVYYWPDTRRERGDYVTNSTSICNYPVQAFATAEIIPVGLVYMWHYIRAAELLMQMVNTVHDSVINELPPEEVPMFHVLSKRALVTEVYEYLRRIYGVELVVPLGAGVMVGTHWSKDGEGYPTEYIYEATEDDYVSIL
jgi:DNA polymerase I-like protein with 3'-5' exonuclease and polymerase domains